MQRHEDGQVHRPGHPVDVPVVQVEGAHQHLHEPLVGGIGDLQPDRVAPHPLAEVLLDRLEQVLDLVLVDRQVAVAGHPEHGVAEHPEAAEQRAEMGRITSSSRTKRARSGDAREQHHPVEHRRHLHHGEELLQLIGVLSSRPAARC